MIAAIGLGELLWSLFVIYLMVMYFVIVISIVMDIFRSEDLSGVKKAIWAVLLLIFPFITAVAYLIIRGRSMTERRVADAVRAKADTDDYIRTVAAAGGGVATELEKAKTLLDSGAISADEYATIKSRLLA
jgi:type VI protein secretion system component VasK